MPERKLIVNLGGREFISRETLLKCIDFEVTKLDPRDTDGHSYWRKFREFIEELK